jgi:dUTP pyrophosphatase
MNFKFFRCDPNKHTDCEKSNCYVNGGDCRHTIHKEFEQTVKIMLDADAIPPTRAHETDAGIDLCAKETKTIPAGGCGIFKTGVHVELPAGTAGLLVSKSGLNVKHDLTSTGLIDEGYTGEIVAKLYNHGATDYVVKAGDKITQLVIIPVHYPALEFVKEINTDTARGAAGFGSTGK